MSETLVNGRDISRAYFRKPDMFENNGIVLISQNSPKSPQGGMAYLRALADVSPLGAVTLELPYDTYGERMKQVYHLGEKVSFKEFEGFAFPINYAITKHSLLSAVDIHEPESHSILERATFSASLLDELRISGIEKVAHLCSSMVAEQLRVLI